MEAGESKICRTNVPFWVWRLEGCYNQEEQIFQLEGYLTEDFSLTHGEVSLLFYSELQLIRWGLLTLWRAISFTKSTDLNVNLIQKFSHRNIQNTVWPTIWITHGPAKFTYKINHYSLVSLPQHWKKPISPQPFFFFFCLQVTLSSKIFDLRTQCWSTIFNNHNYITFYYLYSE